MTGRGVVLADDGECVEVEYAEVVDAATDALAIAAAALRFAAFRTVLDNRGVSEGERRGAVVVSAAAAPVAAVICLAAAGVIVGQGAAGDVSLVEKRAAMAPPQPSPPLCPSSPSAQPWDRQGQGCNAAVNVCDDG